MAIRNIVVKGDEILGKKCKPIKEISERVRVLAEDMIETMIEAEGVGLAAPQVGVMKRLFVARPDLEAEDEHFVMINPEIISREGEQECVEGCLSVPGYVGVVQRPMTIKIKAQDLDGKEQEYEFSGFAANVICHEYDHLEGLLYTDIAEQVLSQEEYDRILEERAAEAAESAEENGDL